MVIVSSSKVLVAKTRTGKDKFWQAHVGHDSDGNWYTQSSYWQTNNDGSLSTVQFSEPYKVEAKNVGKVNETSLEEQAWLEFNRSITAQVDKGYVRIGGISKIKILPMLAKKYTDYKKELPWPVFVQAKLNGQRMLFDGDSGWSRGGKDIIPEVINHLQCDTDGMILDGELMLPGNKLLQETMKATKKYTEGLSDTLIYVVYDIVDESLGFAERYKKLSEWVSKITVPNIKLSTTHTANSETEIFRLHKQFVSDGFEGTMVRLGGTPYKIKYRCNQLLKYKDFTDAEFKIMGVEQGNGRFLGAAIFVCETEGGVAFRCMPEGTMEHRRSLYEQRDKLVGNFLTIRFQELSNDRVPLFPVGVEVRETATEGY